MSIPRQTRAATHRVANPSLANQPTIFAALNTPSPHPSFTKKPPPPRATRPKTSGIWEYAEVNKDGQAPFSTVKGEENIRVLRCTICLASGKKQIKQYKVLGGNPHFREHILKAHKITIPTVADSAIEQHTTTVQEVQGEGLWNDNIRVTKRKRSSTASSVEPIQLRYLFLNWIANDNLSFSLIESDAFRAFLQYVNPHANELLPLSHNTARKDLTVTIQLRLPVIIKIIAKA